MKTRAALVERTLDHLIDVSLSLRTLQRREPGMQGWLALGLTMAQLRVLLILVTGGAFKSGDLAEQLGIGPSAVTPLVDALVAEGLAQRAPDPDDRRVVRVRATAKAVKLHDGLLATNRAAWRKVLDHLHAAELERVQDVMTMLREAAKRAGGGA